MTAVAFIVTFGLICMMTYAGYRDGAFSGAYALARHLVAFLVAMTLVAPVAGLIGYVLPSTYPWDLYARVIALATLYAAVLGLARWAKTSFTPARVPSFPLVDHISGVPLGLASGIVLTGFLLILWSLMPFARYLPQDVGRVNPDSLLVDSGGAMLGFYSFMARKMPGGRTFLLEDEPVTEDVDGDGEFDDGVGEEWKDVNRNGRWDRGWLWYYGHNSDFTPDVLKVVLPAVRAPEVEEDDDGF